MRLDLAGGIVLVAILATMPLFAIVSRGRPPDPDVARRPASAILGRWIRYWMVWLILPLERLIVRSGMSPVALNVFGASAGIAAGGAFAVGHFALAAWLIALGGISDILDGRVARARGMVSRHGAFLDSTLDRWAEAGSFVGIAWYFSGSRWMSAATVLALAGSLIVSYTRARGEALGVNDTGGLMQRAERVVLLVLGALFDALLSTRFGWTAGTVLSGTVVIIAAGTVLTTIHRTVTIARTLISSIVLCALGFAGASVHASLTESQPGSGRVPAMSRPLVESPVDALPEAVARADPARKEVVLEWPPMTVPAAQGPSPGMLRLPLFRADMPVSGSFHRFRVEIRDARGQLLPADRLHHVILFDPDHGELFGPIVHRVLAAGRETGSVSVPPFLLGMPLTRGQRLIAAAMISNPDTAVLAEAHLRIVMQYTPADRPWPLWRAHPWFLDVRFPLGGGGGSKAFDLPPGRSERSYEGSPALAGTIVAIGGHVHDYAVRIELRDLTSDRLLWEGTPVRDSAGRVLSIPHGILFHRFRLGARISPRHRYRVSVVYDNPYATALENSGMGEVVGLFVPDHDQPLPPADYVNATYRLDLENILRNMRDQETRHEHGLVRPVASTEPALVGSPPW